LKIVFGSCFGLFNKTSDIFKTVIENDPDLWIWLGDVTYADDLRLKGCIFKQIIIAIVYA
jgi:phosphodiesterase/alkaline phosphatase D-like protein